MDAREEDFGEDRLIDLVNRNKDVSSSALIKKIVQAAQAHSGDGPQMDDMTVAVIKRKTV